MPFQITAVYASLLAILLLILSLRVVQRRLRLKVGLGTGQLPELEQAVRAQANFTEYVPLILLLLAFHEQGGGPAWTVHVAGASLLVARILHPMGLARTSGRSTGRFIGMIVTWLVLVALAVTNLARALAWQLT